VLTSGEVTVQVQRTDDTRLQGNTGWKILALGQKNLDKKNQGSLGLELSCTTQITMHQVTKHNTSTHNILSTAPLLSISQEALGTLPEDGNVMPKHVRTTIHN
jgi:hypothetical protein